MTDTSVDASTAPRVVLKPRKANPFFGGHPWVFRSAVASVETESGSEPAPGTPVELWSADQTFIAHGLWNGHSNICVRLYSWKIDEPFDDSLIRSRIRQAVRLRQQQFNLKAESTGCRLFFSEADGLSGLTVDQYGGYLLVQFTSLAMYCFKDIVVAAFTEITGAKGIWLRTEKGMREAEGLEAADGLVSGSEPPRPLFIEEHGIRYGVDVQQGQKTGCYLDQRDNRHAAARYMKGRRLLDAFCFSGGFGITAARVGQAASVTGIDSSEPALKLAQENAALNEVGDRCRYERADVRDYLKTAAEQGRSYDAIILDPPRMARSRGGLNRAVNGYRKLNLMAVQLLPPEGILVTCSCSGLVSRHDFCRMIGDVSRMAGRPIQILEQHGQPCDHPISATCSESEYLKMLICRVL